MNIQFGSTVAGLMLQKILLNDPKSYGKVATVISELHKTLNFLTECSDWRMYDYMWNLIVKDYRKRAKEIDMALDALTHLQTTITGICRQKRREYLIDNATLGKRRTAKLAEEHKAYLDEFRERVKQYEK